MANSVEKNKKSKIVIATRTSNDGFADCVKKLTELLKIGSVVEGYIVCDMHKEIDGKINVIFDPKPTRATAFNLVIDKLKKGKNKYHLLVFSKEVELQEKDIKKMIEGLEKDPKNLIVIGYGFRDNIFSEKENDFYANGKNGNRGIAYQVPWNTCALWNKEFVCGEGKKELIFDEICENNQLGGFCVKVDGILNRTGYIGMEDGLALAALISKNKNLKFKLINKRLPWNIIGDNKRKNDHKIKMARKNIVMSTFMNIKGYSVDKLMAAKK